MFSFTFYLLTLTLTLSPDRKLQNSMQLGPESYDRDVRYRRRPLNTTISKHRIGMTISLRRGIVSCSYVHHLAAPVHRPAMSLDNRGHVQSHALRLSSQSAQVGLGYRVGQDRGTCREGVSTVQCPCASSPRRQPLSRRRHRITVP